MRSASGCSSCNQELKIDFPVYALFTKADLVDGFREYFGNFTENRRRKVWGATFQTEDRKKNLVGQVPAEFDALVRRLTEELPDRLHEEPDGIARIAIFGFPAQVAALRDRIAEFLNRIFEPTRYQTNANLRGFYFSSGTQEGTPIDQVLGVDGSQPGGAGRRPPSVGPRQELLPARSADATSSSRSPAGSRSTEARCAAPRSCAIAIMAVIALVSLAAIGAWGWSYASNKALIASVDASIGDYRVAATDELSRKEISGADAISGDDLGRIASYLSRLRVMPAGYALRDAGTPLGETFGLSQRGLLTAASETTYRNALERMLRSRLILRLEQQIADQLSDPMRVYEALKVYLMLGGKAPKVDDDYVMAWMSQDWEENLLPGRANERCQEGAGGEPAGHARSRPFAQSGLRAERRSGDRGPGSAGAHEDGRPRLCPDQVLGLFGGSQRLRHRHAERRRRQAGLRDPRRQRHLADQDPGLYSYAGFHDFFFKQLGAVAAMLESEHWVMGEAGKQSGVEDQFGRLGPELLDIYSRDFIEVWEKAFDNLKLRSVSEDKPDYQVLAALSSDATSPLRQLLESIKAETALTQEREEPKPARDRLGHRRAAGGRPGQGTARSDRRPGPHRHQSGAEEIAGEGGRGQFGYGRQRHQPGLEHRGLFQALSQLGRGRARRPADRPVAAQSQRYPRKPAGHGQLSLASRPGQREAAPAGRQSARHRFALAEAVRAHDLGDRRRVRRRRGRQHQGADEPGARRRRQGLPARHRRQVSVLARLRRKTPRSASSRRCSVRAG